jgi:hypothetical protein
MAENSHWAGARGPMHRSVETGVAVLMAVFALVIIAGSVQAGIGWGLKDRRPAFPSSA